QRAGIRRHRCTHRRPWMGRPRAHRGNHRRSAGGARCGRPTAGARRMNERALRFGDGERLGGVLALPDETLAADAPCIILLTAGLLHRPGPYRAYVDLARRLADAGYPVLRFDLSGIGESGIATATTVSAEDAALADA